MESRYLPLMVLLLSAGLAASQEVVRSFNGTREVLLGVQVAVSGELLVRSNDSVYVINASGRGTVVSLLNGSAAVFQQSDILSPSAALRCVGRECGLHPLNNLEQANWTVNLPQSVSGLSHSIITRVDASTISLNTAEVVDGRYLDARRYGLEFASSDFSFSPGVEYRSTAANQICSGGVYMHLTVYHSLRVVLCTGIKHCLKRGGNTQVYACVVCMCASAYTAW